MVATGSIGQIVTEGWQANRFADATVTRGTRRLPAILPDTYLLSPTISRNGARGGGIVAVCLAPKEPLSRGAG